MAIVASGPVMNFVVAVIVFASIFAFIGAARFTSWVDEVLPGYPAEAAGIKPGDRIISVNGTRPVDWPQIVGIIRENPGKPVKLEVERADQVLTLVVTPVAERSEPGEDAFGVIGIRPRVIMQRLGILQSLWSGLVQTLLMMFMWVRGIAMMVAGKIAPELVGPVGITQMIGEATRAGVENVLYLTGTISTVLGLTNLLPIPALDGSKITFLVVEWIRGKPVDPEKENFIHFIGFAILIVISIIIALKDIQRLSTGGGI